MHRYNKDDEKYDWRLVQVLVVCGAIFSLLIVALAFLVAVNLIFG